MKRIPYGKHKIEEDDIASVVPVLRDGWITQGPMVEKFEKDLAAYCGAKYAVAVSNGTAALHLALLAAGIGKGDEVITTPITFLATPNSVLYTQAKPVFADIKSSTVNIDPDDIEKKLTKRTAAIMPVHFAGLPCAMGKIKNLAGKKNIVVIEDACHALGAGYVYAGKKEKVGSCRHSDMCVFSFHPVKTITTGEGGAITTNSEKFYDKMMALRSHGKYKDKKTAVKGPWYYEMRELGYNYRITDIQCALGVSQLKKIDRFVSKRREVASYYDERFREIRDLIELPDQDQGDSVHARHLYLLRLNLKKLSCGRKYIFEELERNGIGVQVHYAPVYKQPYYQKNGYRAVQCTQAEKYYAGAISLPIFYDISKEDMTYVADTVIKVVKAGSK
ncbi:MAG TPA: UDP-4-amino-4,6-dideoxy-N-acetyl-beta-L-altrosamine transaminase [Candidatus Omnitrophota bacterium]|nr:UDP-4-amino-4,6-dideoxy-N-acetyl-beta-L-altrosamine transaminase [Candidatus Omnitrophota bacterium]HPS19528.1 UDP-4-amino-4,6-dideoxy-N-acetyl-beta-L-altrosamine transaminase [Candidatus Omnitrophota bacterium]